MRSLVVDRKGALWVGMLGGGVARYKDGHFTAYAAAEGLPDQRLRMLYEDRQGRAWAGTNLGLSLFQDGRFVSHVLKGVPDVPARSLCETRDGARRHWW